MYRRLADLKPEDCRAHAGMSRAYLAQGLADHAIRSAEEARKLCPDDAAMQVDLGRAYAAGRYPIEAIQALRRAIELDPNRFEAYEHLGQLCFERSLYPEAIAVYEAALVRPGLTETRLSFTPRMRVLPQCIPGEGSMIWRFPVSSMR